MSDFDMFPDVDENAPVGAPRIVVGSTPAPAPEAPAPSSGTRVVAGEVVDNADADALRARLNARTKTLPVKDAPTPVGFIFGSRSGGEPHVVGVVANDREQQLTCTCKAYLNIDQRPTGCWAMQQARHILALLSGE